jgi:hemolysin activation/secretion protein
MILGSLALLGSLAVGSPADPVAISATSSRSLSALALPEALAPESRSAQSGSVQATERIAPAAIAQTPPTRPEQTPQIVPPNPIPQTPLPSQPLPPPTELLPLPPALSAPAQPGEGPPTIPVERFQIQGDTIFNAEVLAEVARRAAIGEALLQQVTTKEKPLPILQKEEALSDNTRDRDYRFYGEVGQVVSLTMESTEFATHTGQNSTIENFTLLETGTYEVRASAASESGQGQYRLTVMSLQNNCPEFTGTEVKVGQELTFAQILEARDAVTHYYGCRGYTTSGALLPPQTSTDGQVNLQVVEGQLEDNGIQIEGTRHLQPSYIRDRIERAITTPLNINRLLEGLRLLQIDPLIQSISADLQSGSRPGTNRLVVRVAEADSFSLTPSIDNSRSPSVGSFRRQVQLNETDLFGFGDGFNLNYSNTDGSDGVDVSYTIPINPRNGTLRLAYGATTSQVIELPFERLNIESTSHYYEVTLRQPLLQSPTEELALGLTASRQESRAEFSPPGAGKIPFPALGADEQGRTRISALRFFQEWTRRGSRSVVAARSQFSLGLDALGATTSDVTPDSRFFTWRGQGQWVQLLAPETLLLVRGEVQLGDAPLLSQEQFSLGGQDSIRGYRQDALLTDNGALLSAELRIPLFRVAHDGVVQIVPFVDVGKGWNSGEPNPPSSLIAGTGVGLLWRQGNNFTARLDWGLPLVPVQSQERTWQENGIYFSVIFMPF